MDHLQQLWNSSSTVRVVAVGLGLVLLLALLVPDSNTPPSPPQAAPATASESPFSKAKALLPTQPSPLPVSVPGKLTETVDNELQRIDETGRLVHEGVNSGARVVTGVADALLETLPLPTRETQVQP